MLSVFVFAGLRRRSYVYPIETLQCTVHTPYEDTMTTVSVDTRKQEHNRTFIQVFHLRTCPPRTVSNSAEHGTILYLL